MNKNRFKKELSNLIKNKLITAFYIEQLFKSKKSFFNDEKVDVLIRDNYSQVLTGIPKGSMDIVINTLYSKMEMKEFMEREDSIKLMLNSTDDFDFKLIIADSDMSKHAQDFINNNFDYIVSTFDLKKIVAIFEYVDLIEENKEKIHEYYLKNKEEFLKEILTKTLSMRGHLSEKESGTLIKIVTNVVDKAMNHEKCKVMDIKTLLAGSFSSVIRVGDIIIKVGTPRKTFDIPNDERILQPHLRRNLRKELGIAAVIEVADRVDIDFEISEEEMYQIYKEMRDRGVVCGDFKYSNLGKLLKDNHPKNSDRCGLHGNVTNTLKAGEYVLIDTDFVYEEGNPQIELSSDMSIQFEKRYQREMNIDNDVTKDKQGSNAAVNAPVKKGR